MAKAQRVFISGSTGYMGRQLIPALLARGHTVRALIRPQSQHKLPAGCTAIVGNALDATSYREKISPADTFVHLVGVAHPSPAKAAQFRSIDLVAAREGIEAGKFVGVDHFIYVSVAQPAPVMKAYVAVRSECESLLRESGLNATNPAPLVCARPPSPLALPSDASLLAARARAGDPPRGTSAGVGKPRRDDIGTAAGG